MKLQRRLGKGVLSAPCIHGIAVPIGVVIANWYDEFMVRVGLQTAMGQALAVEVAMGTVDDGNISHNRSLTVCVVIAACAW